ncbi:MAG: UDP-N-acetylmuramoyl-L-alanine--D-glutamate ligase [Solirubrobacterales bacterium]
MRASDLDDRRVTVWGAGREGLAALRVLGRQSPADLFLHTDEPLGASEEAEARAAAAPHALEVGWGPAGSERLRSSDVLIRSPGVSLYRPEIERLKRAGVRLTTGTNLWLAEHGHERLVVITGTKGKSTTSHALTELLTASGVDAKLAGNIGSPLLDRLDESAEVWVLELSSYQLADLDQPVGIGAVLNLLPEHLDWHGSWERYYADKLRLLELSGTAVLNATDPRLTEAGGSLSDVRWFGSPGGYRVVEDAIHGPSGHLLAGSELRLRGAHNLLNLCAALTVIDELGGDPRELLDVMAELEPLPHRLEQLGEKDGLVYVNDSIATIPEATIAALDASPRPLALLVGGHERQQDYGRLIELIFADPGIETVIGLPGNGSRIIEQIVTTATERGLSGPPTTVAADIDEAVACAAAGLPKGGTILLSPGAPSYGKFRDFTERGEKFAKASGLTHG